MMRQPRPLTFSLIGARSASKGFRRSIPASAAEQKITYDDQLAPILRQRCSSCHNSNAKKADLDITNYAGLMRGGSSGAAIEPGDPDSSHLFLLVTRHSA